ncbi:MAG: transglutaminase domain-containing protein [Caldilineaceae bacterium]|nr:transglutaminase domain-containing protein [Caldilineaceae bacterium]
MPVSLDYYALPGPITAPGARAAYFDGLPGDLPALCRVVQGVLIHVFWAEQYGVRLTAEQREEVQLRLVARQLGRVLEIDPRPLTQARPPQKRLVGNCRDFSVLLTAMLRRQGVPARARCGFGRYFIPNHYVDHWVCEYWNAAQQRWVLVDAQLDQLQREKLGIQFDPLDVPRDQFIVGGKAWQLCRSGAADPDDFGIMDMHGLWFVRGDFVRDVAALNKVELLPWDSWGLAEGGDEGLTADDYALLDHLAELTSGDVPEDVRVRRLYEEDARLRVPATISSYTEAGKQTVALTLA